MSGSSQQACGSAHTQIAIVYSIRVSRCSVVARFGYGGIFNDTRTCLKKTVQHCFYHNFVKFPPL